MSSASPRKPIRTLRGGAETSTVTSVGDANANTAILAANEDRVGALIENQSSAILYLLLNSGTASVAAGGYSVSLSQNETFEVPAGYTGAINGIWASDAGGYANITEFT